ncbi:MAG: ThiF family adenylyltransferase [Clostridiales bacterium]|nr:ThiF family adenylyltransferase [Clostridiales bacterium]
MGRLDRTEKLIGAQGLQKLRQAHVLVVGLGGVGGCVFEMLARGGIGCITAVDGDVFEESNLNRQLLATLSVLGTSKADAAAIRAKEIAPDCVVTVKRMRFTAQTADEIFSASYSYVADCIDSVADKNALIETCVRRNIPVISALGAGNRTDPAFAVTDIYKTSGDGLARVLRKKLRQAGIEKLNVVCDTRQPLSVDGTPGSVSYAPNLSGCVMAQKIITDLLWNE